MWNIALTNPVDTAEMELKTETIQTSDTLIKTPGQNTTGGTDWENADNNEIQYPGLQENNQQNHKLSENKIQNLESLGAETTAEKFNLPNIYIEIDVDSGSQTYTIGDETELEEAETVIPIERNAVTEENEDVKPVQLKIRTYQN